MKHLLGGLAVLFSLSASAGPIGYAQATGYFKKESRPTLYQPLNLLDGRDATAWCTSTSDPLGELLTFGFKGSTRIEELKITTGNNFDEHTFAEFSRGKKLVIKVGRRSETFTVLDQRGPQTVTFNPPLEGSRFSVEVVDHYPSDDPEQPVCLTDVVFVSEGKALNGSWLTTKLKYDKNQAPLMGSWYAGFDGTPDRSISFYFDGTYRYAFEPYDQTRAKEKVLEGGYEASASKLSLELPGTKGKKSAKYSRDPSKNAKGGFTLELEGELPEDLKGTFRSIP